MNLVRSIGRILLGSFFVANGYRAIREPEHYVAALQPVADRLVPLAQKTLPPEAASYMPEDTATLVRLNGAATLLGGASILTGIGRRGGAALAAASMVGPLIASNPMTAPIEERDARRSVFIRNLALLGAALIVTQDTQGRPSLAYRAQQTRQRLAKEAEQTKKQLAKDTGRIKKKATRQVKQARKSIESKLS